MNCVEARRIKEARSRLSPIRLRPCSFPRSVNDLNDAKRLNGWNDWNALTNLSLSRIEGVNRTYRRAHSNRQPHARLALGGRHRFRPWYCNNYDPHGVGILCGHAALYIQRARRIKWKTTPPTKHVSLLGSPSPDLTSADSCFPQGTCHPKM